jgi:hypothetical protein
MDFTDILKIYGPMAIGWVLYAFERKNNIEERKVNTALQDRVMQAFLEDTKAKILQQTAYEKLIAVLSKPV